MIRFLSRSACSSLGNVSALLEPIAMKEAAVISIRLRGRLFMERVRSGAGFLSHYLSRPNFTGGSAVPPSMLTRSAASPTNLTNAQGTARSTLVCSNNRARVGGVVLEISAMSLEGRTLARIIKEFGDADQAIVADLLRSYYGREQVRVCWNILELSK